jgi:hypothetical protein
MAPQIVVVDAAIVAFVHEREKGNDDIFVE